MEKENHGTFAVDVTWFLFRNIQHREGETPGEVFPSFWLCQKFTLSCALEAQGYFADCGQRPGALPLDPTSFSSEKIKEAKRS